MQGKIIILFYAIPWITTATVHNGICLKYWKEAGDDTCYKRNFHQNDFFGALRDCQNHREFDHFLYQDFVEDTSLLLTIGKLYDFYVRSTPQEHFKSKIWLNAIKFNGKWIEIHQVPTVPYIELTTILPANLGQEIFPVDFKLFGFNQTLGQELDGLIFDPLTNKLELSSTSNAFSSICTHKKLKRPGTKCPGNVAECSDRGYCYHGYCQCRQGFSGLTCLPSVYVMIVGGSLDPFEGFGEPGTSIDVLDLRDETRNCSYIHDIKTFGYPNPAVGLLNGDKMIGCFINECFLLDENPAKIHDLSVDRVLSTSISVNGKYLWLTGGSNLDPVGSTEIVTFSNSPITGPSIAPVEESHCLVHTSPSEIMIIGGDPGENGQNVYFFDTKTNVTRPGISMPNERNGQMCAAFYSQFHGNQLVVAVTGGEGTTKTDFYIVSEDRWEAGPELPESISKASAVPSVDMNGMILLGGERNFQPDTFSIELICSKTECYWRKRRYVMDSYRVSATAIRVPSEFVKCHVEILRFKPPIL